MLHNIRHGKYFENISLSYEIRVIEYQNRGNKPPIVIIFFYLFKFWHALRFTTLCHLVIQLHNTPDITEQRVLVSFINKYITAECPDPTTIYSDPEVAQLQAKYCNLVNTCMVHKCYPSAEGGCLDDMGKCKRNYDNDTLVPETYLDDRGFPVYRTKT